MSKETRAEKADRLYLAGRVHLEPCESPRIAATVEGDTGVYYCTWEWWGVGFCECTWGLMHAGSNDVCSHVQALLLVAGKEYHGQIEA